MTRSQSKSYSVEQIVVVPARSVTDQQVSEWQFEQSPIEGARSRFKGAIQEHGPSSHGEQDSNHSLSVKMNNQSKKRGVCGPIVTNSCALLCETRNQDVAPRTHSRSR